MNVDIYFKCYKGLEGYYLDEKKLIYKKCYSTCGTCEIKGDNFTHNCLTCKKEYPLGLSLNYNNTNYTNCYENCSY